MKNLKLKKSMASLTAAALMITNAVCMPSSSFNWLLPSSSSNFLMADAASSVSIVAGKGYENGAYVTWTGGSGSYDVYCDGIKIDSELIRKYQDA